MTSFTRKATNAVKANPINGPIINTDSSSLSLLWIYLIDKPETFRSCVPNAAYRPTVLRTRRWSINAMKHVICRHVWLLPRLSLQRRSIESCFTMRSVEWLSGWVNWNDGAHIGIRISRPLHSVYLFVLSSHIGGVHTPHNANESECIVYHKQRWSVVAEFLSQLSPFYSFQFDSVRLLHQHMSASFERLFSVLLTKTDKTISHMNLVIRLSSTRSYLPVLACQNGYWTNIALFWTIM